MTTPVITPSKLKTWLTVAGGVAATLVPIVLGLLDYIPPEYAWIAAVIHAVIAVLTALGVYHAPYAPPGTVVAPDTPAVQQAAQQATPLSYPGITGSATTYDNPWKPGQ